MNVVLKPWLKGHCFLKIFMLLHFQAGGSGLELSYWILRYRQTRQIRHLSQFFWVSYIWIFFFPFSSIKGDLLIEALTYVFLTIHPSSFVLPLVLNAPLTIILSICLTQTYWPALHMSQLSQSFSLILSSIEVTSYFYACTHFLSYFLVYC